ncbi:HNH endonuclease [[Flexibacter] sp. ATCC 35208]|uniref:HNH endonuclease n=1 Tax=[Flexibacter] sp. ATCC 35208 TaxID=1936242 RepID=UPI0009D0A6D6|nr:HNH endonuclease signature motif containing protein [[Flexibacter] sp. ATCC 35208]OMP75650.1 hypothetical protein BW716_28975 [[Flexibacter] sp. ATCC 35208]
MRPVEKWQVGQNQVVAQYVPHNLAKPKLLENFGNEPYYFCNYCDRVIPMVNLEIEHIQCVRFNSNLEHSWANFLLACKNCNLAKSDTNVAPGNILLPQFQNTWNCFIINNDGTIEADEFNALAHNRALQVVELLGLNRGKFHPLRQDQDDRYDARRHALMIAKRALKHYEDQVENYLTDIIFQATSIGFWYVWMKTFENYPEVQDALIQHFNGTYANCRTTSVDRL